MLGSPVLSPTIDSVLEEKLIDLKRMTERLKEIDPHDALFLLKNCFAIPKLMYFLRASPCYKSDVLKSYDHELKISLERIINTKLTDDGWKQSTLPVSRGGLGVRSAVDLALPAFISSAYASNINVLNIIPDHCAIVPYPQFFEARNRWLELTGATNLPLASTQAVWDEPLIKLKFDSLLNNAANGVNRARILAVSSEHASQWLNAIPIPSLGLKMDSNQLRISIGLRLGSPLCHPHQCKCGVKVETNGIHGLSCSKSAGRFSRHGQINDLIKRGLSSAHIPAILEPNGVSRDDGKRPDGLSMIPWKNGKLLCWDYTCSDSLAPSHISISSVCAGKVAKNAENVKFSKYSNLQQDYEVVPICVESMGPWGPSGLKFIQEIGRKIKNETREPRSTEFLMQAISVAVQRGNAASVMGTLVNPKNLEEIFYL